MNLPGLSKTNARLPTSVSITALQHQLLKHRVMCSSVRDGECCTTGVLSLPRHAGCQSVSRTSTKASDDPLDFCLMSNLSSPANSHGLSKSTTDSSQTTPDTTSPPLSPLQVPRPPNHSCSLLAANTPGKKLLPITWDELAEKAADAYQRAIKLKSPDINISHILLELMDGRSLDKSSMVETSIGAVLHSKGICKPCVFANKNNKACRNGEMCLFCHHSHQEKHRRSRRCKNTRGDSSSFGEELKQGTATPSLGSSIPSSSDHQQTGGCSTAPDAGAPRRLPVGPPPGFPELPQYTPCLKPLNPRAASFVPAGSLDDRELDLLRFGQSMGVNSVWDSLLSCTAQIGKNQEGYVDIAVLLDIFSNLSGANAEVQSDAEFSAKLLELQQGVHPNEKGRQAVKTGSSSRNW